MASAQEIHDACMVARQVVDSVESSVDALREDLECELTGALEGLPPAQRKLVQVYLESELKTLVTTGVLDVDW